HQSSCSSSEIFQSIIRHITPWICPWSEIFVVFMIFFHSLLRTSNIISGFSPRQKMSFSSGVEEHVHNNPT
ncbi:14421_t:CDS:2, partial [Ambispora leptoticha]